MKKFPPICARKHIKSEYVPQNKPYDKEIPKCPFGDNKVRLQKFQNLFHTISIDNFNTLSIPECFLLKSNNFL